MNKENTINYSNEAGKGTGTGPAGQPMEMAPWAGGGFLILLGVIFLLTRGSLAFLGEAQWLVWMLVPIYWVVVGNYYAYIKAGRRISPAMVIWTVFPFAFLAVGFIIGWNVAWPIILIAIGISLLMGRST